MMVITITHPVGMNIAIPVRGRGREMNKLFMPITGQEIARNRHQGQHVCTRALGWTPVGRRRQLWGCCTIHSGCKGQADTILLAAHSAATGRVWQAQPVTALLCCRGEACDQGKGGTQDGQTLQLCHDHSF